MSVRTLHALATVALAVSACTADTRPDVYNPQPKKAWEGRDAPSLLDDDLVYTYAALPTEGEAKDIPWAANYWPTYKDNLNDRWGGKHTLSPAEKFEKAFRMEGLTDAISAQYGIDSQSQRDTCKTDDDCNSAVGEACAIRHGEEEGRCVETWFGICHAWAPAAIMEKEPVKPVTFNGVTFAVNDIKGLISLSYDKGLDVKFISLRCNKRDGTPSDTDDDGTWITEGAFGIPEDAECADTNAGAFHVVIANFLGLQGETLVEDRTFDYEVWNQPIRGFRVTRDLEIDAKKANKLVGVTEEVEDYQFNPDAVSFRHIGLVLEWIAESAASTDGNLASVIDRYTHEDKYEYVLELDADGKIIGGEWIGASKRAHPDFLWLPYQKNAVEVAKTDGKPHTGIKWQDVQMLLDLSLEGTDDTTATEGFDWGSGCDGGSGTFQQDIAQQDTVEVGTIPAGKHDVRIDLKSEADVDVQLLHADGTELVAWPDGMLNGEGRACIEYDGVGICYSGYNGDGENYGHEYIEIRGTTASTFKMSAFGYAAGDATVDYSWQATPDCNDAGEGSFKQALLKDDVVHVGLIPAGKSNVRISLAADADVDIQLFDGGAPLVQWPDGQLSGARKQVLEWEGLEIEWSGYNGQNGDVGNEYIEIRGTLPRTLTLRAFGYQAGAAQVDYAWGLDDSAL